MNANQPIIITVKLSRETKNTYRQAVPRQSWSFS